MPTLDVGIGVCYNPGWDTPDDDGIRWLVQHSGPDREPAMWAGGKQIEWIGVGWRTTAGVRDRTGERGCYHWKASVYWT